MLGLSCAGVGTRTDTGLHRGLRRFLEPYLDKTVDGRHYFRDSHQRQIVRVRGYVAVCPNPFCFPLLRPTE